MLRIGKNPKEQEEIENTPEKHDTAYSTQKTYPPYQSSAEAKPVVSENIPSSSRAITESESLARDIKEGNLSGFVGSGTAVTGEATFKAMMRVDGHLSGRITSTSGTLIVGANGKVDANIEVAVAMIHGTINGDIIATQRLELGRAAKVTGNVQTPSLVIEQGAIFEGTCKMMQMSAERAKSTKVDQPLDTSKMKPIPADTPAKPAEISSVSKMAS
jgi:cytoskeletal protein CcmA (bactofilin family)